MFACLWIGLLFEALVLFELLSCFSTIASMFACLWIGLLFEALVLFELLIECSHIFVHVLCCHTYFLLFFVTAAWHVRLLFHAEHIYLIRSLGVRVTDFFLLSGIRCTQTGLNSIQVGCTLQHS